MLFNNPTLFPLVAGLAAASVIRRQPVSESISVTPHEQYSSSVGVLGCKIDTNRVAYWPLPVSCDNLCVRVTHAGRSLHLLRIDQSGSAYDISYDAWNFLYTGESATEKPAMGGGIPATYENVTMTDPACQALLNDEVKGKLPLSAPTAMNFYSSCNSTTTSTYAGKNAALFNIYTSTCSRGVDEACTPPDVAGGFNQPECGHQLGLNDPLPGLTVKNVVYGTGVLQESAV